MGVKAPSHPFLAFSDEELPIEGDTHTRLLPITIECMGAKVPMVLIDNGSALNVRPFRTAFTMKAMMKSKGTLVPLKETL